MTTTMPPTTHALPHSQRLRLMRSTRKLSALLGETPLLVENSAPCSTSCTPTHSRSASAMVADSRPSGHIYMASAALPCPSSLNLRPQNQVVHPASASTQLARPMLLLHLPAACGSPSSTERTPLQSPLSSTFSLALNSPATPTFPVVDPRRRKMAKVMRTLGENVPPELVFPTSPNRRRASTLSVPNSILERGLAHPDKSSSMGLFPVEAQFDHISHQESRPSIDTLADSADTHASESSGDHLLPYWQVDRHMHRKEQGWSGEWGGNVSNMEEVVRTLRGLKIK
ncbi:hypothetical protein K438DRAFT_1811616 [Mycena galopus ATCC 62051]|nr:hypothetical protein K438DRAFT_1811616 [Mycena galopus ATCC 62051]